VIDWASEADIGLALRIAVELENFWVTQDASAGARRFETLIERASHRDVDAHLRVRAWRAYGACLNVLGRNDESRAASTKSGELAREAGDESGHATSIFRSGVIDYIEQDLASARRRFEQSLEIFQRIGDDVGELQALQLLGNLDLDEGQAERGKTRVERSLSMAEDVGWLWWQASCRTVLAVHAQKVGAVEEVEAHGCSIARIGREIGDRNRTLRGLSFVAWAALERGDATRAAQLVATIDATERVPGRFGQFDIAELRKRVPGLAPGEQPLPLDEAVAYALGS
jgi:tetratricopeptide (TPR) repeat protein